MLGYCFAGLLPEEKRLEQAKCGLITKLKQTRQVSVGIEPTLRRAKIAPPKPTLLLICFCFPSASAFSESRRRMLREVQSAIVVAAKDGGKTWDGRASKVWGAEERLSS